MTSMEATQTKPISRLDEFLALHVHVDVEVLAYTVLLLVTVITRFAGLGTRVMSHDESLHTYYSYQLAQHGSFQHSPLMHGPLQFHLIALSYLLFGATDATARIPAALFSIAAIVLVLPFRRYLGRWGTFLTAVLMAISPYMLYYGRYVRNEALIVPLALASFYAVFRYFESRQAKWLYLLAAAMALHFTAKETAFIYSAQLMVFLALYLAVRLLREPWKQDRRRMVFAGALTIAAIGLVLAGVGIVGGRPGELPGGGETIEPLDPTMEQPMLAAGLPPLTIFGGVLTLAAVLTAAGVTLRSRGKRLRQDYPSLDLMIVLGTFVLPQLAAFPALALGWDPMNYQDTIAVWKTGIVVVSLVAFAAVIGLAWNRRRWLIAFGIFYGIFALFFTTVLTHPFGLFTGLVGALGYWLEQHGVNRGSQPLFYYVLVQIPIYEFLPAIGAMSAGVIGLRRWLNADDLRVEATEDSEGMDQPGPTRFPVVGFIGFWALTATVAYTIAGERMPWLTVHIALPYILLAGWVFGRLFQKVNWSRLVDGWNWLIPVVMVIVGLSAAQLAQFGLGPERPFAGSTLDALRVTTGFVMSALVFMGCLIGISYLLRGWSREQILRILGVLAVSALAWFTARSAYRAAFLHYDQATEYLVYAHSATGVKTVISEVRDLSTRIADGMAIEVAYDDDVAWPFSWYMRDFPRAHYYEANITRDLLNYPVIISGDNHWAEIEPILGDRYYNFQYVRMWWPNQDYFHLSFSDIETEFQSEWFEAHPDGLEAPPLTWGEYLRRAWGHLRPFFTDPIVRKAVWQIWFNRDFSTYANYTGRDFSLQNWSPSDRMRMYVRKDVAAMIWNYGLTEESFSEITFEDPYADGMIELAADLAFPDPQIELQLQEPRNIAAGSDGSLFIADTRNHRILKLSPDGEQVDSFGQPGTADMDLGLNEPWGLDVAPDGSIYIADTWNHRILHVGAGGEQIGSYGELGQAETLLAFWGPRDVAVHPDGRVFVSDTGNKRIVILSADGEPLGSIGSGGTGPGQLDEPVGLAFDSEGRLFVADTWNQRIQVFQDDGDGYNAVREWPVDGWYGQSLDNKPYLDVSDAGMVCTSDPEGFRILCFDEEGEYLLGWGSSGAGAQQFGLPSGISFLEGNQAWVADARNGRVMRFALPSVQAPADLQ